MDGQREGTPAGRAVARRRAELRYTQTQLAEASGVSRRTIQSLESGEHMPTLENLIAIERALDWAPGHLMDLTEETPPTLDDLKRARQMLLDAIGLNDPREMREKLVDALAILAREQERRTEAS